MDPLTITTTFITLATFIKDLIDVGEGIRRSIEKVSENRRQIRELIDEIVQILYNLADLTWGHEDTFRRPKLLTALENLKTEMLYVHCECNKISAVQPPGFHGVRSRFKAWRKRDDLEAKIGCLKERVSKCYTQFTAFSVARIEHNTLRIEQTAIINHVENQVKVRRLEGMMAQVLLETPFGQNIMNRTVEIISADPTHSSLESQYMSAQTMGLITLLEGLLISGKLVLNGPLFIPTLVIPTQPAQFNFTSKPCTPLHLLHEILGVVININKNCYIQISLGCMQNILVNLGVSLSNMGMVSESIAWEHFKIRMLRHLDSSAAMTLPDMAYAFMGLSVAYHWQHQFQSSIQASQQSLDLWHHLSDSLPDVDIRICLIMVLTTQTRSLLKTSEKMAALSIAQDAVALSRPMLQQMIKPSSGSSSSVDNFNADWSCAAIFELAKALSSLNHHLKSYEALKEGFQTIIRLPIPSHLLLGECIDLFLDQICKVVEGGSFSLPMLVDCVILLCNLARIYPEQFLSQFISLLHAYAYFAQQDDSPSMENIRLFLEPKLDLPPPKLDVTRPMNINFGGDNGFQIEDVIRAFHCHPLHSNDPLILNIFITHFDETIAILRDVVEKSDSNIFTDEWILWTVARIIQFLPTPNQLALLQVLVRTIEHFGAILANRGSDWQWVLDDLFNPIYHNLWKTGLLNGALKVCGQAIRYLDSCFKSDEVTVAAGYWRLNRHFILCDMGRYSDAIGLLQQATIASVPEGFLLHPYIVQIRILHRTGRNQEALQLLRKGVAAGCQKCWTDSVEVFQLQLHLLLAESAAAWGHVGNGKRALKHVERAVAVCRKDMGPDEEQKCVLIHSLITLSNCLATLGRNGEALMAAEEAVSIYTENVPHMWGDFLYTIRKQELGANVFHALSLRLVTSGKAQPALLNTEKATELYRELVALAPRHLPTLASSLRNLGSILWDVGCRDEAIAACEEAVGIMRKVSSPETYFCPALAEALEQLAGYLGEKGDVGGASAAAAECAQVRREFAALPPEPEFLFEKVVDMVELEDKWEIPAPGRVSEADDEYHDASEGPSVEAVESDDEADKYHDASEPPTSIEPLTLISELSSRSSTSTPGPAIDIDTPVQANPAGDPATAILGGSSTPAVQNPTSTDTAKSILSKPLELDVRLRLRSTLMDVVWWVLLGILFAIAAIAWRCLSINGPESRQESM